MNRKELILALEGRDIHEVYGQTLSHARKRFLEEYYHNTDKVAGKRHFSVTQVGMWLRCHWQYHERYLEGKKLRPTASMSQGSSAHTSFAHNFVQKITSGSDEPLSVLEDVYVEDLQAREEETDWSGESIADAETNGRKLIKLFRDKMAPPLYAHEDGVEHQWKVEFEDRPWVLMGFMDLRYALKDGYGLTDWKTTAKSKNQKDADANLQLTTYSFANLQEYKEKEKELSLRVLVSLKRDPKPQVLSTSRSQRDYNRMLRIVDSVVDGIRKGNFAPCDEEYSWWCSPERCGFYNDCHSDEGF